MKRMRKDRGKSKEKGQSITEFAIMLPFLLLILAGVLDLGRLYYVVVTLTDAAAEGATYAAIHPDDTSGIVSRAQAASTGLVEIEADQVTVEYSTIAAGAPITVGVDYDFVVATPLINAIVPEGKLPLHVIATEAILRKE